MPYGNLLADVVQSSTSGAPTFNNTSGTQIGTLCRAWAQFNGSGTVAASFNVSSVTINGSGDFTVTFTNAMADAKYSAVATGQFGTDNAGAVIEDISIARVTTALTTLSCRFQAFFFASTGAYGASTPSMCGVAFFR